MKHTIAGSKDKYKGPVEEMLKLRATDPDKAVADHGLTLGEIVRALDLDKTRNGDVAATLIKIRNEGNLLMTRGPATSVKGPRWVTRYRWRKVADKTKPAPLSDDRRFLSLCR